MKLNKIFTLSFYLIVIIFNYGYSFNSFVKENPDGDPMEAFNAAGEFVNDALDSEFRNY